MQDGKSVYLAAPVVLILGALIGLLNGVITLRFNIPSFIATLGAMLFWKGMTLLYHGATSLRFRPEQSFVDLIAGQRWASFEAAFLWFVGLTSSSGRCCTTTSWATTSSPWAATSWPPRPSASTPTAPR